MHIWQVEKLHFIGLEIKLPKFIAIELARAGLPFRSPDNLFVHANEIVAKYIILLLGS